MAASNKVYKGNLYIWQASSAYTREVEHYLELVQSTSVGKALIKHVSSHAKWMRISPFNPTKKDPVNAYASNTSEADAAPGGYVADTTTIKFPLIPEIEVPTVLGTGKGSTVEVFYHPATWNQLNRNTGGISPGSGPGEILFHEMVHGHRMQAGLLRYRDKVPDDPDMDSIEEYFAILAANVYRSERGFTKMRANHHGFKQVKKGIRNSDTHYENYQALIDKWFDEQRSFCLDMAKSSAKFNPFREAAVAKGLMPAPTIPMRLP